MYIRRDKSNLHFGRQARRRGGNTLFIAWIIVMLFLLGILWRFDTVQTWVLASMGDAPTATPDAVTWARQGERAYLSGDIEAAIDIDVVSPCAGLALIGCGVVAVVLDIGQVTTTIVGHRFNG